MKIITNAKMSLLMLSIILVAFPNTSFGQATSSTLNLGILTSFEGYTGGGAITTAAGATWIGDVGANVGVISGDTIQGNVYGSDTITAQCKVDLMRLYIHLNDLFVDYPATHAAAFGVGETITPGVYSIPSAGSIGGALTLNGEGDPDAFFIIKFNGAMTVGAGATINLINGTQSCNVFFIAQGAISVAANAYIKGTLFAKVGAVGLGTNTYFEGRMLSMEGAITVGAGSCVGPPPGTCTIPISCGSGSSPAPAVDVLGVLSNYALYTNLGAVPNTSQSGITGNIGTDGGGTISGYVSSSVVLGSYETGNAATAQAKIDLDNAYTALMALPNTVPSDSGVLPVVLLAHAPAFGSVGLGGETINAGVYFINGAGSLLGTLVLDAQNDPDAIFVFKFAGAFTVAAQAKMILSNGARRSNVFFIGGAGVPTGAVSIAAGAVLKGTFLSHGGACGSGASVFLEGRQLSTGGAVVTYSGIIYNNKQCITTTSLTDTSNLTCPTPSTPGLLAFTQLGRQHGTATWEAIPSAIGYQICGMADGDSSTSVCHLRETNNKAFFNLKPGSTYCFDVRVMCPDSTVSDPSYTHCFTMPTTSPEQRIQGGILSDHIRLYPNPATDKVNLELESNSQGSARIAITDVQGRTVLSQSRRVAVGANNLSFDIGRLDAGIYHIQVVTDERRETTTLVVTD